MAKASAYYSIKNNKTDKDLRKLKKEIDTIRGIISVSINADANMLAVDYDTTGSSREDIESLLKGNGVEAVLQSSKTHLM